MRASHFVGRSLGAVLVRAVSLVALVSAVGCTSIVGSSHCAAQAELAFVRRPFAVMQGERWIGNGICYSPYRDGQRPAGTLPTEAQLREDLDLIAPRWQLLRTYGSRDTSETMLRIIREQSLPLRIVLGVWIAPEVRKDEQGTIIVQLPEEVAANQAEVREAIRLARAYPEIVAAISVGNETQVSWSAHRSDLDTVIAYIRQVRAATTVPVTSADDFKYWRLEESRRLSAELDFLTTHIHPLWNGVPLEQALAWTRNVYAELVAMHPGVPVVIGESGWATRRLNEGEQAKLMLATADEAAQKQFFAAYNDWVDRERIISFWFEAFDENWKGSDHPDEAEKHWGLYYADRRPKPALVP